MVRLKILKLALTVSPIGIDQYRQRKTKTQLAEIDEEEGESAMAAKMAEIEGALAELQKLMEEENS